MGSAEGERTGNGDGARTPGRNGHCILIVEDETLIGLYLVQLLGELEYDVSGPAASADRALDLAGASHPDIALVDLGLSGRIDGLSVAIELRDRFDIPTIFLSDTLDAVTLRRAEVAAPLDLIQKPFSADRLASALKGALAGG